MIQKRKTGKSAAGRSGSRHVRLKPANPFDLIRLIAHSQNDCRKAMAELVQNSLDAGAQNITVIRRRRRGDIAISVFDDGSGVFPDMDRPEALEHIATNIGHSFKRNLSALERQQQMMLGKYGIGILGFWCVGRELEMRSRVDGSEVWCLRLERDEPGAVVARVPQRTVKLSGESWTEVTILGVHPGSSRLLSARRLGEYLGAELRGQLLSRKVKLRMLDRVARGRAVKDFLVVPKRFRGRRIESLDALSIPGFAPARLELYYVGEDDDRDGGICLSCGGTVVHDDLSTLDGHGLQLDLWSSARLEGIVEFPDLEVSPGTRRGIVPGPAAEAFFQALKSVEPTMAEVLDEEDARRRSEEDENLARELRKVFKPLAANLPQYDFFDVGPERARPPADGPAPGEQLGAAESLVEGEPLDAEAPSSEVIDDGDEPEAPAELLPPGPLASLRIVPARIRLLPGATRELTARAADEDGRRILEGVRIEWSLGQGGGALVAEGARCRYTAPAELGPVKIEAKAWQGLGLQRAAAELDVVEKLRGENPDAGIPDPKRVFDKEGDWRSRVNGRVWEFNAAHPDYLEVVDDPRRRLRYMAHLFSKEIVLHNYGEPKNEALLERMVEVLTHIKSRA